MAVRSIGLRGVSTGRAWFAAAAATAISNTLGFHALTATAVRYRLFTRSGLTVPQVAGVTALSSTALVTGFGTVLAAAMIASPSSTGWQRVVGMALFFMLLAGVRLLGTGRQISFWGYRLRLPSTRMALAQMALGLVEMASAIGALYILIPANFSASFPAFCALCIGAVVLGIVSHAPGGLGIFEVAMLAGSPVQGRAEILAALLLYRLIYNLCPFLLAVAALGGEEVRAALSSKADRP
jgi:phosphatidylglycerol lysyltransferase